MRNPLLYVCNKIKISCVYYISRKHNVTKLFYIYVIKSIRICYEHINNAFKFNFSRLYLLNGNFFSVSEFKESDYDNQFVG